MISKLELKKQLRELGIQVVGNYVNKKEVLELLGHSKKKVKGNRAEEFRKITKVDEDEAELGYIGSGKDTQCEDGYVKITDFKALKKGDQICVEGNEIYEMMGFDKIHGTIFSFTPNGKGCAIKCKETGAIEGGDFDDGVWYLKK